MYWALATGAYITDALFGEFRFLRHPVVMMGDYIAWFEHRFYRDNRWHGAWLALSLLALVAVVSYPLTLLPWYLQVPFASMFLAHKMLYESVFDAIGKREKVAMLVSRDTESLDESDLNKALVETYAENLSDGVIAPLLYLLFFGVSGAALYKAVNTLDSMVGYRNLRYRNFGLFSAKLDDLANWIPARVTALLMMLLYADFRFRMVHRFARGHASPNAGYPISAAACIFDLKLGGPTPYHGKLVAKPWFGAGRSVITASDIRRLRGMRRRVDFIIITGGFFGTTFSW